ncbi:large neutral amino acids transporter small subunit 4-like isoform X2 [Rana temporaria]|uniref:large neutral amino acids transporter small subunit 4-like isoform X2 n=1 Tax=Rana temporaria TaxID=8407 RepID=UPI001AAC7D31|nr:large neutral amino acids transporter small subunit 4-like isoform X2 [Rana temporaria]
MGGNMRLWVLGSALVETLLFSGCLLGWNSLSPILVEIGVLARNCYSDSGLPAERNNYSTLVYGSNYTDEVSSSLVRNDPGPGQPALEDFCISQEQNLNLAFTLGSFFLWGSFLPLQLLLGYVQIRSLRQIGGALIAVSCLMLAYCCTNPPSLSMFLPFALVAQGVGGSCVAFSSLMLPHFLPDVGAVYPSLVIASFAASATVLTIVKVLYNFGVPLVPIVLGYGALSFFMFLNSFFCWKLDENISDEGNMYRVRLRLNCSEILRKKEEQKEEWCQKSLKSKFHASLRDRDRLLSRRRTLSFKRPEGSATPSLQESLMTPTFILHLFSDSVLLTWIYFYISSLNLQLRRATDLHRQADLYSSLFGALQMLGLFAAPLICVLLHNHHLRKRPGKHPEGENRASYRIVCSVKRLCVVYGLRTLLICGFGVVCLVSSLELQILAFVFHIIGRASMFMVSTSLYHVMFHKDHFGSLLGIHTVITSLFALLQHPLFLLLTGPLEGDPFWIHVVFLALSLGSFAVPVYLVIRKRQKQHHVLSRPVYYHPAKILTHPAKTTA